MKKSDLVEAIAKQTGLTKADSTRALDAVLILLLEHLRREKEYQ